MNISPIDSKFECSICYNIFTQPMIIENCSHTFCKSCIMNLFNLTDIPCPLCKQTFNKKNIIDNKQLEKEINKTEVKCHCGKDIKLKNYNKHVQECNEYKNNTNKEIKSTIKVEEKKSNFIIKNNQ
jgi:hypothetical protein